MKFPDFIVVGSMKCGTTVLWHNLNKHPDINMGKNWEDPKVASTEIRFWNNGVPYRAWERGFDWYKDLFEGKLCGEKCANYIEERSTMDRMAHYIPNVKLVLCIRNPVDRAYSEYQMQRDKINRPFNIGLARERGYLYRGSYYTQIANHILPFFSKENLHIIIQEQMKNDTNKIMNELYTFLGAESYELETLATTQKIAADRGLDLREDSKVNNYKVWSSEYEPLSDTIRKDLFGFYKPHNEKLFNFLGYEIGEWNDNN